MNKPSVAESPAKTNLNPILKAALSSLDIQLDDELKRYRRRRAGKSLTPYRGIGKNPIPEPVELISLPVLQTAAKETIPLPLPQPNYGLAIAPETLEKNQTLNSDPSINKQSIPFQPITSTPDPIPTQPDDYLESSEKLINSLDKEEELTSPKPNPHVNDSLLNPLGIGSILLLLLASATLGYVIFLNWSSFTVANLHRILKPTPSEVGQNPQQNLAPSSTAISQGIVNTNKLAPIPNTPNLASQEFVDLNLNTIGILNPSKPQIPPSVVPPASSSGPLLPQTTANLALKPSTSGPSVNLTSALLPPPGGVANQYSASAGTTSTLNPKAAALSGKGQDVYYYVLTDYKGDESLQKARKIVADAYLRDFPQGTRIQLGAYKDATTANLIVEQLRKQGLDSQVYKPQ